MSETSKIFQVPAPVMRSLARVMEWEKNPRRGVYTGIAEMKESLIANDLQDAIHVWERAEGDLLLKGHRRLRAMKELGWTDCRQVVLHFADEREAYLYLLQDHGHTVALNPEEKIAGVETGVALGLTVAELAPAMGVKEETAQLYFDLGQILPVSGRTALATGQLSLGVAELLKAVEDADDRHAAVQCLLKDSVNGDPMGVKQAHNYIQAMYVLPKKRHEAWIKLSAHLRKKVHKVEDGFAFVEWHARLEYVQGESGQPYPDYQFGDGFIPKDGRRWMEKAAALQVPVYVVPAPLHVDGYVLLVSTKMLRDAEKVPAAGGGDVAESETDETDRTDTEGDAPEGGGGAEVSDVQEMTTDAARGVPTTGRVEVAAGWLRVMLGAIYEHLVAAENAVWANGPWEAVMESLVSRPGIYGAVEAFVGAQDPQQLWEWVGKDTKARAPMRIALMLALCEATRMDEDPKKTIRAVAEALGMDVGELEKRVGG